jgi:hypothetical protein
MALSIKRLAKLRTQIGRHGDGHGHGLLPPHSAAPRILPTNGENARQIEWVQGSWSLISVVTPLPPTVLPLDGPANVPSGGDQTVNLA